MCPILKAGAESLPAVRPAQTKNCRAPRKSIKDLASRAYRRPTTAEDLEGLMTFYERGRKGGDFESGIRMATQAILTSPHFIFRFEQVPSTVKPGQSIESRCRLGVPAVIFPVEYPAGRRTDHGCFARKTEGSASARKTSSPDAERSALGIAGHEIRRPWLHLPDLEASIRTHPITRNTIRLWPMR